MSDDLQDQAIAIIGEDRVPQDVLQKLVSEHAPRPDKSELEKIEWPVTIARNKFIDELPVGLYVDVLPVAFAEDRCTAHGAANPEGDCVYCDVDQLRGVLDDIAAGVPKKVVWNSAADFMEDVAGRLDRAGIERPDRYEED